MANFSGTIQNDTLQGTDANDSYNNVGVGQDVIIDIGDKVKNTGGKDLIDLSSAGGKAIVDLRPGETSNVNCDGSFTLGNTTSGSPPDIVYVIDRSGSTTATANGVSVGDQNNDGQSNTVLDAEIAGFIALNDSLIAQGFGNNARVQLVDFDSGASQVGLTVNPTTDANANGVPDIVDSLRSLTPRGSTNYEAAFQTAQTVFNTLGTPPGSGNLVFLSDGQPNTPDSNVARYADEVAALKAAGVNVRAFGVAGATLPILQGIDPNAQVFTTTDQLTQAFSVLGGTLIEQTLIENLIGTGYNDYISGNNLGNFITGGAGNDRISGVDATAATPGKGEVDTLAGGAGFDTFVLGDGGKVYYNDGDATAPGIGDYALITDLDTAQDKIKLEAGQNYMLGSDPINNNGQALFLDRPGTEPDELLAVFQGINNLNLNSSVFTVAPLPAIPDPCAPDPCPPNPCPSKPCDPEPCGDGDHKKKPHSKNDCEDNYCEDKNHKKAGYPPFSKTPITNDSRSRSLVTPIADDSGVAELPLIDPIAGDSGVAELSEVGSISGAPFLDSPIANEPVDSDSGYDVILGENGFNVFQFTGSSLDFGVSNINNFDPNSGLISLDKGSFTALQSVAGSGFSVDTEFAVVTDDQAADISDAFIVYNSTNGSLFYNQDGATAGFGDGGQFAALGGSPGVVANNFVLA
jgi:Ca2+-binding RTX toxin-like protein